MRLTKPMIPLAIAGTMALALSACGGSSGSGGGSAASGPQTLDPSSLGNVGTGQNPDAKGPVTIDGATQGGTVKVISFAGLNTMDPTEAYYTNTSSILSGLVTRSLTQYSYDPSTKQMILVPDLATDLGQHNADFTKWEFTIRDGVKYENGDPVTAQDVLYGIERSFDRTTFPEGANYSNTYFKGGDTYQGPFTDKGKKYTGATVSGNTITINMVKPFPDMPYWGAFPAMGPIPQGQDDPSKYALHPLATGPYMFKSYTPEKSLVLVKNPNWDPATDPARTQYPDEYDMDFQTPTAKVDQIMASSNGDAASTLSYDNIQSTDLSGFDTSRLVTGSAPCTYYWAPDYRKITDINVRRALAYAYPYKDTILSAGFIEGVTAITDQGENLMPPGIAGRTEFTVNDGLPGTTDPAKSLALLKQAGQENYTIKFTYATDDPSSVASEKVIAAALKKGGFNPQPIASTVADSSTVRADPNAAVNVRSAGWCSDWPSGGSWFPPLLQSTDIAKEGLGQNFAAFSEPAVDSKITSIQQLPIDQQSDAWNALDQEITDKYFPMFTRFYTGVAMMRGANIEGMNDDNTFGMPTWKDIWLKQ